MLMSIDLRPAAEQGRALTTEELRAVIIEQHGERLKLLHALIAKGDKKPKAAKGRKKKGEQPEQGIEQQISLEGVSK